MKIFNIFGWSLWGLVGLGMSIGVIAIIQDNSRLFMVGLAMFLGAYAILVLVGTAWYVWLQYGDVIATVLYVIGLFVLLVLAFVPGIGALVMRWWYQNHPDDIPAELGG